MPPLSPTPVVWLETQRNPRTEVMPVLQVQVWLEAGCVLLSPWSVDLVQAMWVPLIQKPGPIFHQFIIPLEGKASLSPSNLPLCTHCTEEDAKEQTSKKYCSQGNLSNQNNPLVPLPYQPGHIPFKKIPYLLLGELHYSSQPVRSPVATLPRQSGS